MKNWLGRQDSNLRMTGSKPVALPLGYAPKLNSIFVHFIRLSIQKTSQK